MTGACGCPAAALAAPSVVLTAMRPASMLASQKTIAGGSPMAIQLDHLIVPARDPIAAARSLAGLLDVPWQESQGPFTPVYVNDTLTLDFADRAHVESHHYCFRVSDAEFDAIFGRIQAARIPYRSSPLGETDMQISRRLGGKNLYWQDGDGHLWEILTVSYARPDAPPLTAEQHAAR
jgi:catechol 2,3-dioxygenase-like lactoylglutathione lyase family enzyme